MTTLLVFLYRNGFWIEVDPTRLYNFAVWVAESDPSLSEETIAAADTFVRKNMKQR